jgi:tRNA dimethylallyltransferase
VSRKNIFVLYAPTASGKTAAAIELAKNFPVEIISADSRQVYRFLDIGTAKPAVEERALAVHHLIDILNPDETYSAGAYRQDAEKKIEEIYDRGNIPLVVGGSGLYVMALCNGLFEEQQDERRTEVRAMLNERLLIEGKDVMYSELKTLDAASAMKYTDKNPRRVLRALEFYYTTGVPLSGAHQREVSASRYTTHSFSIELDVDELNRRINHRSQYMWENGLVEETQRVLAMGYSPLLHSLNSVGYKEAIAFCEGRISRDEAIHLTAQSTRRYAKRQRTWMRHQVPQNISLRGSAQEIAHTIEKTILSVNKSK